MIQSNVILCKKKYVFILCIKAHKCVGEMSTTLTFCFLLISIFNLFLITADGVEMMGKQNKPTKKIA